MPWLQWICEYADWAPGNSNLDWTGNSMDVLLDMNSFLLATMDMALLAQKLNDILLYLDSVASTHISCMQSDFPHLFSDSL